MDVLRLMQKLVHEQKQTIVMVTHELSEILPSINRVILMKNGKIAADGKKEDLIRSDILSDLYGRKVSVAEKDGILTAFCLLFPICGDC